MSEDFAASGVDMPRLVAQLVESEGKDRDFIRDCLWRLMDNAGQAAKKSRRSFVYVVLVALVIELLNRGFIGEVGFLGVKLAKLDFLLPFLPIVAAYYFLLSVNAYVAFETHSSVVEQLTKRAYPGLYVSRLWKLLLGADVVATAEVPDEFIPVKSRSIDSVLVWTQLLFVSLLPVAFSVYAIVQVFRHASIDTVYAVAVSVATLIRLTLSISTAVGYFLSPDHATDDS
jgi:hypothetical protein